MIAVRLWMDSGAEEDFIRVNITNTGEAMLIKEKWFQPASTCLNEVDKGFLFDVQGVRAESPLHE